MKILIACGGTGGHIYPGLSLYNILKKRQPESRILLVLVERAISFNIVTEELPHIYISLPQPRLKLNLQIHYVILKLLKGILQSLRIIVNFKPHLVVGFGGYASFLLVLFAWVFRIKTVIYEQNVIPGRANRLLSYITKKIAVSFKETEDYFGINASKVEYTGGLLRPNLNRVLKSYARVSLGLTQDKFTILIMGGSQGAHKINIVAFSAISLLDDKTKFQIIHLCGAKDHSFLYNGYRDLGIEARVFIFLKQMQYAYSAADMVISRAGAVSISELAYFGLPSILIPYPYICAHQVENAKYLFKDNAAILLEEKSLNPGVLMQKILELSNNQDLRESMSKNILKFSNTKANERLADLVMGVCR